MQLKQKRHTIFYGWWVVGASFLIAVYTGGVIYFGFTAIFEPIRNEFGWSYAQISLAASLRGLEMGLLAPVMGVFVDRWGPRKMMFGGSIIIGLGLLLLSTVNSLIMFYVAFIVVAIGMSNCSSTVKNTAVANWFHKKVALASGIVAAGFAVGGLLVPVVTTLVDTLEWRGAMVVFALGMWGVGLPLSLLMRHKPEQYGYLPDGEINTATLNDKRPALAPKTEVNISGKQAVKSRAFWHIALAMMCQTFLSSAVVTHVMPYLGSIGFARSTASMVAMGIPLSSIGGRLGFGLMGDIFNKKRLSAIGFALMSLGLVFFALISNGNLWLLVPSLLFFGTGWGANVTMRPALLREYFGRSRFGTIHGFTVGILMIGIVVGAPLAGWAFDVWGSYEGIWLIFAGAGIAGIFIILKTPPPATTIPAIPKSAVGEEPF